MRRVDAVLVEQQRVVAGLGQQERSVKVCEGSTLSKDRGRGHAKAVAVILQNSGKVGISP